MRGRWRCARASADWRDVHGLRLPCLRTQHATLMSRRARVLAVCAQVAHNVSASKRRDIVERATQLNIALTNRHAKVTSREDE